MSEGGTPPLPWLAPVVAQALGMGPAHALLLHGAAGDGLFECAQLIAQAWLCESDGPGLHRPCGRCIACRSFAGGAHPDLHSLLPEDLRQQLGGSVAAGDNDEAEATGKSKRKPSRQIRISEVRAAIDWIVTTSSRGRAKVVLVHPAEAMNPQSANALLKTLEEPPQGARLLLTAAEPERLLPTVRSRCQVVRLPSPGADAARRWLSVQGLVQPDVLLAASSMRPLEAVAMAAAGIDAERWTAVPGAVRAGQASVFAGWSSARVLDAMQKLCHDGMALAVGGAARFFPAQALSRPPSVLALANWSHDLTEWARRIEHPWNEGLLAEAMVDRARAAWQGQASLSDTLPA